MTYQSPEYHDLARRTSIVRTIQDHIDRARDFRVMTYSGAATISALSKDGERIEIRLGENATKAMAAFMADYFVEIAANIEATQVPTGIDVKAASKV